MLSSRVKETDAAAAATGAEVVVGGATTATATVEVSNDAAHNDLAS